MDEEGEILKFYNDLDQSVIQNHPNQEILNLCDKYDTFNTELTTKQTNTCKKLIRNLLLCNTLNEHNFINFCSNLYVWLYFETKKSGISNDIIKKIFDLPKLREKGVIKFMYCPYDTYNDQRHDPEDLMKLSIFNDNVGTFQSMLMNSNMSNDCSLKKYVYECVDIYNKTHEDYSSLQYCNSSPEEYACGIIQAFNSKYTSHIRNKGGIIHEFPELSSNTPLDLNDMCPLDEIEPDTRPEETQQGTPTTQGASTALSAMVGIPPFLILMYKFTQAKRLFRFGNKNNTIITSNIDKNMENELFHAIKEDSNIKDIPPKYNIGYEPK
ncbi:VIR protein [Plasmodium vivax]|uniref:VIR protein n=1 Tax=Plasmodium vivax TaxID=5855 RepID=A0A1G4GSE2_PLAVI|nr:VIR protein [Plasmodium vivax]